MAEARLFTQRELILLTQTHPDIQVGVYEVQHKRERGWHLRIPYQDKKNQEPQHMTLVTARGNVRTFKNLDTAIDYIKEHCPHIQAFGVYFMEPAVPIRSRKSVRSKPASKTTLKKKKRRLRKAQSKGKHRRLEKRTHSGERRNTTTACEVRC